MKTKDLIRGIALTTVLNLFVAGCGSSETATSSSTYSASSPEAIVKAVAAGIKAAGTGFSGSAVQSFQVPHGGAARALASSDCDSHGYPDSTTVPQNNGRYPGVLTYCFMTKATGDTVLGGFDLAKQVSCAINLMGPVFDGTAHSFSVDATSCFSSGNTGVTTLSGTLTASSPASFNSNYDKGFIINLSSSLGLTFKIGANVSGSLVSFITEESWTSGGGYGGATVGSLDTSTGALRYESRVERADCTTSSSCGFNRHSRVYASLTMSNGSATGVNSLSFAYANIQKPPGQNNYSGVMVTADGVLSTGVKARFFQTTNGSMSAMSDYRVASNWGEVSNTKCYSGTSESASGCGSGLAPALTGTFTPYVLAGSYTGYDSWFTSRTAPTFSAVDVASDTQ